MHSAETHIPNRNAQPCAPTSSDLTHGGDGRVVGRDASEGFGLHWSVPGDPQHQSEQALVPAEGLLGQLAPRQRGGQRQVELEDREEETVTVVFSFRDAFKN